MMKKNLIPVISILLILIIFLLSFVISQAETTGEFEIGNQAPYVQIGSFAVQDWYDDGEPIWDSTDPRDTHDRTPHFVWATEDINGGQTTSYICIGTVPGDCSILAETSLGYDDEGEEVEYTYPGSGITLDQGTDCTGNFCSKIYYVTIRLVEYDTLDLLESSESFAVTFTNYIPDDPYGLIVTSVTDVPIIYGDLGTHDPTPDLTWIATDPDDGTQDKWPADSLTLIHHVQVGTSSGDETYLADPLAASASATVTNPIPWGTPGAIEARSTVSARMWLTDIYSMDSGYYNIDFSLIDNLPEFMNVYLSDELANIQSCIDFLPAQHCYINPLSGDYTSVNLKLTIIDNDQDCSDLTHTSTIVLCRVDAAGAELCDLVNNAHYVYDVGFLQSIFSVCDFRIIVPQGNPAGIEFFRAPGVYKMYVDVSSQAGMSTIFPTDYEWEYTTLQAIDYTDTVYLGDRAMDGGDNIQLGSWNPGLSLATMTNHGNVILGLDWDATDPSLGGAETCDGQTATCWDLTFADDFQIDDDMDLTDDIGNLAVTNIPETGTGTNTFQPAGGLQVCDAITCDNVAIDETLDTYFHIKPPIGLSAGIYQTDITITIS